MTKLLIKNSGAKNGKGVLTDNTWGIGVGTPLSLSLRWLMKGINASGVPEV